MSGVDQQLLNRKTQERFAWLDTDGNGFIEWNDYLSEAQEVLHRFDVQKDSAQGRAVIDAYHQKWNDLVAAADTDGDGRVSLEEFTVHMTDPHYCSTKADQLNRAIGTAIMDMADSDEDGKISREEFLRFPTPARAGAEQAAVAFQQIDTDGDGFLSKEEVHQLMGQYLRSADPTAAGNQVFGNLSRR